MTARLTHFLLHNLESPLQTPGPGQATGSDTCKYANISHRRERTCTTAICQGGPIDLKIAYIRARCGQKLWAVEVQKAMSNNRGIAIAKKFWNAASSDEDSGLELFCF
jgi:hypothetical protein